MIFFLCRQPYFFIWTQEFSNGFKPGLFPGNFSVLVLTFWKYSCKIFILWHAAPSCMNIMLECMYMCITSFRYFWPFSHSRSKKYKSAVSDWHCILNHLAWWMFHCLYGGSFITSLPLRSYILLTYRKTAEMCDSSESITFHHCYSVQCSYLKANSSHFFLIYSVNLDFWTGLCDFSPNSSSL